MALIKCPECEKEISDKAAVCINCGYPLRESSRHYLRYLDKKSMKSLINVLTIIIALFLVVIITVVFCKEKTTNNIEVPETTVAKDNTEIPVELETFSEDKKQENNLLIKDIVDTDYMWSSEGDVSNPYDRYFFDCENMKFIQQAKTPSLAVTNSFDMEFIDEHTIWVSGIRDIPNLDDGGNTSAKLFVIDENRIKIQFINEEHSQCESYLNRTSEVYVSDALIWETDNNLKPYFDILGIYTENYSLDVSQEFIDNSSSVRLMGYLGSISHGYRGITEGLIDIMDWVSNTDISGAEYEKFIHTMNKYFNNNAILKSYDNISDETYVWYDFNALCMVCGWNENGKVCIRWFLEEELVSSMTVPTREITAPTNIPKETEEKEKCTECGKTANYTYTNPFSGKEELYCYLHYKEIIDVMNMMEKDVGKSSSSKKTCEQCNREGTHKYESFTGQTEYYCTAHYEELKDMLEAFGLD